jgi:hypothetical protein
LRQETSCIEHYPLGTDGIPLAECRRATFDRGERMTERCMTDEACVTKQIVSYFLRNPNAADTLEGIARWRLLEERIHQKYPAYRAGRKVTRRNGTTARRTECDGCASLPLE